MSGMAVCNVFSVLLSFANGMRTNMHIACIWDGQTNLDWYQSQELSHNVQPASGRNSFAVVLLRNLSCGVPYGLHAGHKISIACLALMPEFSGLVSLIEGLCL